jgi:2-ketocyclohexanecarboxyl-CoA hydrolase
MWFFCRRYTSEQALQMGLINAVVADADLDAEVDRWCAEIAALSPTAIAIAKKSFNLDSESIRGISAMGLQTLRLFYETKESREGVNAFLEKPPPVFRNPCQ